MKETMIRTEIKRIYLKDKDYSGKMEREKNTHTQNRKK